MRDWQDPSSRTDSNAFFSHRVSRLKLLANDGDDKGAKKKDKF